MGYRHYLDALSGGTFAFNAEIPLRKTCRVELDKVREKLRSLPCSHLVLPKTRQMEVGFGMLFGANPTFNPKGGHLGYERRNFSHTSE